MKEIWKDLPEYLGQYQVSTYGRIRSIKRKSSVGATLQGHIVKDKLAKQGRRKVLLRGSDGQYKHYEVGLLVLHVFQGVPLDPSIEFRYRDGIVVNNVLSNLELVPKHNDTTGMAGSEQDPA